MILTTLSVIPGRAIIEHYGLVSGSSVRSKHAVADIFAWFKNLFGGELRAYSHLLESTRTEATDRMIAQARQAGANAIVGVRFSTSQVTSGAAEIFAYGTAVKLG